MLRGVEKIMKRCLVLAAAVAMMLDPGTAFAGGRSSYSGNPYFGGYGASNTCRRQAACANVKAIQVQVNRDVRIRNSDTGGIDDAVIDDPEHDSDNINIANTGNVVQIGIVHLS